MVRAPIGRDEEFGLVCGLLERAEVGPAALVLTGEPGIGKTILWEAGVEEAERRAGWILSCRGAEAEAAMSFTGLSDLLAGVLEEVAAELVPLRREALEVALMLRVPGDEPPDVRAIGLAFLDVLRLLAEQGPVLVAVDDLQWLDVPSAAALQLALRRLPMSASGSSRRCALRRGCPSRSRSSGCCRRSAWRASRSGRWA
jgi:hypothetical protein